MRVFIGYLALTLLIPSTLWGAGGLEFPPRHDQDLVGHFTYEILREGWTSKLRQPLQDVENYAIEYRTNKSKNYKAVFLLRVHAGATECGNRYELCGDQILYVLKLPPMAANEFPFLRCRAKEQAPAATAAYLGIVKESKLGGDLTPRLAWRVDLGRSSFEAVDGHLVECPVFGEDK